MFYQRKVTLLGTFGRQKCNIKYILPFMEGNIRRKLNQ